MNHEVLKRWFVVVVGVFLIFPAYSFAQTNPLATDQRLTRGTATDARGQTGVFSADQRKGVPLNVTGNSASQFAGASPLPWVSRIKRDARLHYDGIIGSSISSFPIENPLVSYGEAGGGTPLYTDRDYRFGIYAGGRSTNFRGRFRISAYLASEFPKGENGVIPDDVTHFDQTFIDVPLPGDPDWDAFLKNGKRIVSDFHGLRTTVEIVGGGQGSGMEQWNSWDDPYLVTHRATGTDFYFVVEYEGYLQVIPGFIIPLVSKANSGVAEFSPLYTLDFSKLQPWQSTEINAPHFDGKAAPAAYYGKALGDLQGLGGFSPSVPAENYKTALILDQSPELRSHPALDKLVSDLGSNPIALANYVANEIELVDGVAYNETGNFAEASISCGGVARSALGTYLEGQGNPWEQCALLTYLLRKSGTPAIYCQPEKNKLGILDFQLSKLLRMRIDGAERPDGTSPIPQIVPVNYPYVAAWINAENRWVYLFPWLKDTEVIEGGNLYDQFPSDCKTGSIWVRKYLQRDPSIVSDQVAAYQQSTGADGLVVMEAEGYQRNTPKGAVKWEPSNGETLTGYSGVSWMRAMPTTGSASTNPATSPRLDYAVDFKQAGTYYVWIKGLANGASTNNVYVGLDSVADTSGVGGFPTGTAFAWKSAKNGGGRMTITVPSAGRHTINVWMYDVGFRVDKLVLTSDVNYAPPATPEVAVSPQKLVEPDVPSYLFPKYAREHLGNGTSFESLGMKYRDRRLNATDWDSFPKPYQLLAGNHVFYQSLAERADSFDTIRIKLWSDTNGDKLYTSNEGTLIDIGEWPMVDLHNRRLVANARKINTNTHQIRLNLAPYRAGTSVVSSFVASDFASRLNEQLLNLNTTSDYPLQFEITARRQKVVPGPGIVGFRLNAAGTGYTSAPTVTIEAPAPGTGSRQAVATAHISGGVVTGFTIIDPGAGYLTNPKVTFSGGGGTGASAIAALESRAWVHPLGVSFSQSTTTTPSIRRGDLAAICLNFGRVTDRMLSIHAGDFWQLERQLQATSSLANDVSFQEKMQGTSTYLMGMAYYERVSRFKEINERLHKNRILSMYAAGFSKLNPYRIADGSLPNGGDVIPSMASVDMYYLYAAYIGNGNVHADSGVPFAESNIDFFNLFIAEGSAQEHAIINDYYSESAAISTVKLLHLADSRGTPPIRLTKGNYVAEGGVSYPMGHSQAKALSQWDPSIWTAISNAFNAGLTTDSDYTEVYITPGPVTGGSGSYTGMGAMVLGTDGFSALISGNMTPLNGGSGSYFQTPRYSAPQLPSNTLTSTPSGYRLEYRPPATVYNPVSAPATISLWNAPAAITSFNNNSYTATGYQVSYLDNIVANLGLSSNSLGNAYSVGISRGTTGSSSYFGGSHGILSTLVGWVSDPVNVVTGEFYIDTVDLALPGPFPLNIRRNYASQSLSDNEFGKGWKLAYFPYLVVGDNNLIYSAEEDGSVVAYRIDPQNANRYIVLPADNPNLKNIHDGGFGSVANVMNNFMTKSMSGADTIYSLYGTNGSVRRFKVRSFPVGTITRSRPYMDTWTDANGNSLKFIFDEVATSPSFGQLTMIKASNGNFLGFSYDVYSHITEAWTGDGRRVKYTYDSEGDLRSVTLPDGAVHSYEYEQETVTSGGENAQRSTHLLIKETKPEGRILENVYTDHDENSATPKRVMQQSAVVGESAQPVVNATFTYAATQDSENKSWSGTTTVKDAYNNPTVFTYADGLITSEDDPETPAEIREWYPSSGTQPAGGYPRSLSKITDRRGVVTAFKYDSWGNLVEKSLGTDAVPADIDGDGVASAGEKAITTWTYNGLKLPETETDPMGNVTKWIYGDITYPYMVTELQKWSQGQLVSKTKSEYYSKTEGPNSPAAYGLLYRERVAADSPDEARTDWEHSLSGYPTKKTSQTGTSDPAVVSHLTYNLRGQLVKQTDALGGTNTYAYDPMGRQTSAEKRDGSTLIWWTYTYYNLNGDVQWVDGPRSNPEDYIWFKYDGAGRKTEEIQWLAEGKASGDGVIAPVGDAQYSTTFTKYDLYGNEIEIRSPGRNSVRMIYDAVGRVTTKEYYEGYYNGGGVLKAAEYFTYEAGGEIATHTDVLGGVEAFLYNARGQLRKKVNVDGSVEELRYLPDGRLVRETLRNGSFWQVTYDDTGRKITRELKSGGTTLKTEVSKFDRRGNTIELTRGGYPSIRTYDALDRVKTESGPSGTASSARRSFSYTYPNVAGREENSINGLGEKKTTLRDALGRVQSVVVKNASGTSVSVKSLTYSPDHYGVTVTDGTGSSALTRQIWTDTRDNTVITRLADGSYELSRYDVAGELLSSRDRAGKTTEYKWNWRGDLVKETRPGNVAVSYSRDAMGNLTERTMPGNDREVIEYDTAGRISSRKLQSGSDVTRSLIYNYYGTSSNSPGMLQTVVDGSGVTATYTYDEALRVATQAYTGGTSSQAVSRSFNYDDRDLVTAINEVTPNGTTVVSRGFDGNGDLSSEIVSLNGATLSSLTQHWDAAGGRSSLRGAGPDRSFTYRADGLLAGSTVEGLTYSATYGDNGLLVGKQNPFRTVSVGARDNIGRTTDLRTSAGGVVALKEVIPSWDSRDKITGINSERVGAGSWNDMRSFTYDDSGRLTAESSIPAPGSSAEVRQVRYDGGAQNATGGIGVRTSVQSSRDGLVLQNVSSVGAFSRVMGETLGGEAREITLAGNALGASTVKLTVDGRAVSAVSYPGWADSVGDWSALARLGSGAHFLTASATHPGGAAAPVATSSFTVSPHSENVTNTYDAMGRVVTRTWSGGKTQTLTWDARSRLIKVVQTGGSATAFTWTALYDGVDRRIQTSYTPTSGASTVVTSIYDPESEFLEVGTGIQVGTAPIGWHWKIYGADEVGQYGGQSGPSTLEALIEPTGTTVGTLQNWWGDIVGWIDAPGAIVTWSPSQYLAWGPSADLPPPVLDGVRSLRESLGYRGQALDPTGTIHFGLRDYDPNTGRWLSADPLGHDGSLSLYDYCDNDPVNRFDPDGRFGKQQSAMLAVTSADNYRAANGPTYTSSFRGYAGEGWGAMSERQQISTLLNFVPVVGWFKAGAEIATGYDFVGGEYLSTSQRVTALAGFALGSAGGMGSMATTAARSTMTSAIKMEVRAVTTKIEAKVPVALTGSKPKVPGMCFVAGTEIAVAEGEVAIESLKVGDRVLTTDGNSSTEVDPATWRKITLNMPNPECPSDILSLELLRPLDWITQTGSRAGAQVWFELEEMGLKGWAEVRKVENCPPLKTGRGRVVLATVTHENSYLMEVKFEGRVDTLTPTDRHRLFSVTRNDWVPTVQLLPGEELRTADGSVRVASITPVSGTHQVFNIEVETEHSYFAGTAKVLSHNANPCMAPLPAAKETPKLLDVVPYSKAAPGFEKHHGVLDAWARANVSDYSGRTAPTVVLTPTQHNATRSVFNTWRAEKGFSRTAIDWTKISPQEAQSLSYHMFKAADVPDSVTSDYFRAFNRSLYGN